MEGIKNHIENADAVRTIASTALIVSALQGAVGEAHNALAAEPILQPVPVADTFVPERGSLDFYLREVGPSPEEVADAWESFGHPRSNPYSQIILDVFGPDANNMELVLRWGIPSVNGEYGKDYGGENISYNPNAIHENKDGTKDYGLLMINSKTYEHLRDTQQDLMRKIGIHSVQDLLDVRKNTQLAQEILYRQGYGAWFGAPPYLKD